MNTQSIAKTSLILASLIIAYTIIFSIEAARHIS